MAPSKTLTAEQRVERARAAAAARWQSEPDWEGMPLDEAVLNLEELRAKLAKASEIINRRVQVQATGQSVTCYNPTCGKQIESGRWAGRRDRVGAGGEVESAFACSAPCWLYVTANFTMNPSHIHHTAAPHHHEITQREEENRSVQEAQHAAAQVAANLEASLAEAALAAISTVSTVSTEPATPVAEAEPVAVAEPVTEPAEVVEVVETVTLGGSDASV